MILGASGGERWLALNTPVPTSWPWSWPLAGMHELLKFLIILGGGEEEVWGGWGEVARAKHPRPNILAPALAEMYEILRCLMILGGEMMGEGGRGGSR